MAKRKHRRHHGLLNSLTACISTTMVLILVGTIVFLGLMVGSLERSVKENFTVQVLLEDTLSQPQTFKLAEELKLMPYTKEVTYISKEEATRSMAEEYGVNPAEFIGDSPFPASFEVSLVAEYTEPDSLDLYMPRLKKAMGVMDVIYPSDLMEDVNNNIQHISMIIFFIILLLGIVSVSLINNTIRLNIAQRRQSIQTMKLVGASWGFIRRPFLQQAVVMGLIASVLADAVIVGGFYALLQWDPNLTANLTVFIMAVTLGSVLIVGVSLTLLCAFFSVNRHLAMTRAEATLY